MDYYFRGDTLIFPFEFVDDNGEKLDFEPQDVLKCGVKTTIYDEQYILIAEKEISEKTSEVIFEFSAEKTRNIKIGDCILELELTRGDVVTTIYHEEIYIDGDVVRNESNTENNS